VPFPPQAVQVSVNESESHVEIAIARNKRWFIMVFAPFFLVFLTFGYALLPGLRGSVFVSELGGIRQVLLNCAAVVLLFTLIFARLLLWHERIKADSTGLWITTGVGPFARKREFELSEIRNLRASTRLQRLMNDWPGRIVFDYGRKTHSFGERLRNDQVNELVPILSRHIPHKS
jgi:hypothetical protein